MNLGKSTEQTEKEDAAQKKGEDVLTIKPKGILPYYDKRTQLNIAPGISFRLRSTIYIQLPCITSNYVVYVKRKSYNIHDHDNVVIV